MPFEKVLPNADEYFKCELSDGYRVLYFPTHQIKFQVSHYPSGAKADFNRENAEALIAMIRRAIEEMERMKQQAQVASKTKAG